MDSTSSAQDNQSSTQKMCLACNQVYSDSGLMHCPKDGTQLVPFGHDENLGSIIMEKYKIIELCGRGGMGKVYRAEDLTRKGTFAAIKMLHAQLSEDKVSVKRFQQEASAASDLKHPNLIEQYDFGMVDAKQPFLVMEYLQGESLAEIIRHEGPMNPVRCLRIFSQVMDGLGYAHNKGVVHRDIKPSNILLIDDSEGEEVVKVLDFGLAKLMPWSGKESQHLTKTGEVFGSPIYMSPEQCMGKKLEPSSDIYSLGITLFEALTGKPPFKGQNVVQTASKHLSDPPPPFDSFCPELNLGLNLQSVVFKALEKEVAHRYHNMQQFKEDLTYAVTGQGKASLHMLAAMSADATQPVKKVDLDSLKSGPQSISSIRHSAVTDSPAPSSKPPAALIGIVLGLLIIIGGGSAFFLTGSKKGVSLPHSCEGIVYYLATRQMQGGRKSVVTEVHLQTNPSKEKKDELPHLVKLTSTQGVRVVPPQDLAVGMIWKVKWRGDDNSGELDPQMNVHAKVSQDDSIVDANNLVLNYFDKLSPNDENGYNEAFDVFSSKYKNSRFPGEDDTKARESFAKSMKGIKFQNYRGGGEALSVDPSVPVMTLPTGERMPPHQATKVVLATPDQIQIVVDRRAFYVRGSGYDLFVVGKEEGFWKIDDLKLNIKLDDWNKS